MSKHTLLLLLTAAFSALIYASAAAQEQRNLLANSGFDKGLSGWDVQGEAGVESKSPIFGSGSLRLGPGKAAVRQRYAVSGPHIIGFGATMTADTASSDGRVRVQCYDARGHLLMDIRQGLDPKKAAPPGSWTGIYFKAQARTASVMVSIEKESSAPGYVYADTAVLNDYDRDRTTHAPVCSISQSLQPIWAGKTVYNETVLLESDGVKPASGTLLFMPRHILAIRDYGLTTIYAPGKDYTRQGRTITCTKSSQMAAVKDSDFPAGDLKWYTLDGKHIVVTYTHDDVWHGPVPQYEGRKMPHTMNKLRRRLPLTVVAYGDSITLGDNASGYMQIAPYLPTWADLFVGRLKQVYGSGKITLYNTALGGMTSEWGLENTDSAVAGLDPDLVIIAFGMNDFWSLSPEEFGRNIRGIIHRVRARRPQAEFLLIASMRFDPAYTSDSTYTGHMTGYVSALRSLTGTGVQMLDMNALSGALFAAKKPKDVIANPLHPNDFLVRCYAQGLSAMLTPPAVK